MRWWKVRHAVPVGIACALVRRDHRRGLADGRGLDLCRVHSGDWSGQPVPLAGLTMLTCLVLGMGIPTIPNYIITSSIAAPALLELACHADRLAHVPFFYFGIMADLTPPVALAVCGGA